MLTREQRIQLFSQVFRGRQEVFARRWEKWDKSIAGYAPVYTDEHKEAYQPLTPDWIEKHLLGTSTLGIYPLLQDNTCHFVVADFDSDGWQKAVQSFVGICTRHNISLAIERSRSGNGAHAWCFFSDPYSAARARKIFLAVLREAKIIDEYDKDESYDRLFPSQDFLSGKGLGNLIALPLQGIPRKDGNSVFVDVENDFTAYDDQWEFLASVTKLSTVELNALFAKFSNIPTTTISTKKNTEKNKGVLVLTLRNTLDIHRSAVPPQLISYVREHLNILNIDRLVKERAGLPTYGLQKYIKTLSVEDDSLHITRGFQKNLRDWLKEKNIPCGFVDERPQFDQIEFSQHITLRSYQERAVDAFSNVENGVLVAPAASGKTLMALALIAQKRQPAIILTHRRQIYEQWRDQIESSFGIPKRKIGQISSTKKQALLPVAVAMVQTLSRMKDWKGLEEKFGTVILDECHHVPARMFRDVLSKFNCRYLYGLTATPERKYNDGTLISVYIGPVVHTVDKHETEKVRETETTVIAPHAEHRVRSIVSDLQVPFGDSLRHFPLIAKVISNDTNRNSLITGDVAATTRDGKKCLILTERKEHVEMLQAYLRKEFEVVMYSGDLSSRARQFALQKIKSGRFQILIATGQILGEGVDIAGLEVLFLAFPVSFHGKLAQYVGRIRREGGAKLIFDYRDPRVPLLEKMWKKRLSYYRKEGFEIQE